MQVETKKELTLNEFKELMRKENLDYTLLRSHELRQRFTEYVFMNLNKALINTSLFQNDDSFFKKQSIRNTQKRKKKLGNT